MQEGFSNHQVICRWAWLLLLTPPHPHTHPSHQEAGGSWSVWKVPNCQPAEGSGGSQLFIGGGYRGDDAQTEVDAGK